MLVLSRCPGEWLDFEFPEGLPPGSRMAIGVQRVNGRKVRISQILPDTVVVKRRELTAELKPESEAA